MGVAAAVVVDMLAAEVMIVVVTNSKFSQEANLTTHSGTIKVRNNLQLKIIQC